MPLQGTIQSAPNGSVGFDTDTALTADTAAAFVAQGFQFAVRYLSRHPTESAGDLTTSEAQTILDSGLALMAVQHVAGEGWTPTQPLGQQNGQYAVQNAQAVGLPTGMQIWLDLEGVNATDTAANVEQYCNAWFAAVSSAGYVPGLYVGANCGLTGQELYQNLTVQYYWQSGSTVPAIPTRGYCMLQTISSTFVVDGVAYDRDLVQTDDLGSTPLWLTP